MADIQTKVDRRHEAGPKISATNRRKFGPDYYARIGGMGGRAKVPKGFAVTNQRKKNNEGNND